MLRDASQRVPGPVHSLHSGCCYQSNTCLGGLGEQRVGLVLGLGLGLGDQRVGLWLGLGLGEQRVC